LETTIRKTAAEVRRYRILQEQKSAAERCRRNLSRYFSPPMAEFLSNKDEPLGPVRRQEVTIIFADLVGFTQIAESSSPEAVIEMLRGFHSRMSGIIFEHGGTIEKYIGDAVCAAFGVPDTAETDPERAVMCVMEMCSSIDVWNKERVQEGGTALQMGVGINSGPAVLGDIGVNHSMSFAVIGHTVNVASRLQTLTRDVQTSILVSENTMHALRRSSSSGTAEILRVLSESSDVSIRGSNQRALVWHNKSRYPMGVASKISPPSPSVEPAL
jgi:adenylate cyclase